MEYSQAKAIIGVDKVDHSDLELIQELLEDAIFIETTFFMRRSFVPKLAKKRINKLERIQEAATVFGVSISGNLSEFQMDCELEDFLQLKPLITSYHRCESEIKRILTASNTSGRAISLYHSWLVVFNTYVNHFIQLFDKLELENLPVLIDVKMTDSVDFNELFEELDNENYKNLVWREYIRMKQLIN